LEYLSGEYKRIILVVENQKKDHNNIDHCSKLLAGILKIIMFKSDVQKLRHDSDIGGNFDLWSKKALNFGKKRIPKFFRKFSSPHTGKNN
jgi:hypothetical protein